MAPKKVLLLVRDFPPYYHSLGGVIRMVKLGEFLDSQGYEVHVVASAGLPIDYFGYEDTLKRFNIHYVTDAYQRIYNNSTRSNHGTPKNSWIKQRILDTIRYLSIELCVPDPAVLYAHRLYRTALSITLKHGIANIVSSSPPHSTQIAALMLKRRLGDRITLILDYRDSWNTTPLFSKRFFVTQAINRALERRILEQADAITYASPPMIRKINATFPGSANNSQLILNGYDPDLFPLERLPAPYNVVFTIGHFGAISDARCSFRNPSAVLEVAADFDHEMRFIFFGDAKISSKRTLLLGDRLVVNGSISHSEALQEMRRMDALMLIHSNPDGADEVITSKIFEYMLAGRPIIAFGPPAMEAIRMVQNHNLGYTANIDDREEIKLTLARVYDDWINNKLVSYDLSLLSAYTRSAQYAKLLPLFGEGKAD